MRATIDLHCHILPDLDDGARSWSESMTMSQMAFSSGVRQMVCTPHGVAGDLHLLQRIQKIEQSVMRLNQLFAHEELALTAYSGMELLCNDQLEQTLRDGAVLTLANSSYLLLETPFDERLSKIEYQMQMVKRYGFRPILAHPERYVWVQRNPECLSDWFDQGIVLQLNKGSVLGDFGRTCQRTAIWALNHGLIHILSSDAHNAQRRTPSFRRLYSFMMQYYSPSYAELLLSKNPECILKNQLVLGMSDDNIK